MHNIYLFCYSTFVDSIFPWTIYIWTTNVTFLVHDTCVIIFIYRRIIYMLSIRESQQPVLHAYIQWQSIFLQLNLQEIFVLFFRVFLCVQSDLIQGVVVVFTKAVYVCICVVISKNHAGERQVLERFIQCSLPIRSRSWLLYYECYILCCVVECSYSFFLLGVS